MSQHLAVYGGMFDPVHKAHLEAVHYTLECLQLNKIKMVPCNNPNHREAATADSIHRLRMLELLAADDARIEIDPIEINGVGTSYSSATLGKLKKIDPDTYLVFVLGMDSFNSLPTWHQYESIFRHSSLFVLSRPGEVVSQETAAHIELEERRVEVAQELFAKGPGKVFFADDFEFDISSTLVRRKLEAGENVEDLIDQRVLNYIKEHNLYS